MVATTIAVRYTCKLCGLVDVTVDVPLRRTDEDVSHWVGQTMAPTLKRDHAARSPWCQPETLSEVKIPITGRHNIGGPTVH